MTKMKKTNSKKKYFCFFIALLIVIIVLFPLYPALIGSLESFRSVGKPNLVPYDWQFINYINIWKDINLGIYILNSLIYALLTTLLVLIISIPSAYAISRFQFKTKKLFLISVLIVQMLSVATIIVPLFLFITRFKLFDTYFIVILVESTLALPLGIWGLRSYFDTIPPALEYTAMIDGCNRLQTILYVLLPISVPGLVTTSVIVFTMSYNQFFVPLVFLSSQEKYPALVGIFQLVEMLSPPWHLVMTACIITIFPPLLLYLVLQKYVISGLSSGAFKS